MKIRTKLSLTFTVIVMAIITAFSVWIFIFFVNDNDRQFYATLMNKAKTTAKLYSKDVKEIDTTLLKIIDKNSFALLEDMQVIVYDDMGNEVYRNPPGQKGENLSPYLKNTIREKGEIYHKEGKKSIASIYYEGKFDKLYVVASAHDSYDERSNHFLLLILVAGFILSTGITALCGWYFAGQALAPMSKVVNRVEHITASRLNLRVDTGNNTDEIAQLAITFNRMLDRLEDAFEMQKNFVSNASHELRTPLTAITGQIEVSLISNRQPEEYRKVLLSVLEDMKDLNNLANGLLELTQADMQESDIKLQPIRIDELLWQTKNELLKRKPEYSVSFKIFDFPEEESQLVVYGNHLLKTAIMNIMDNACKFSGSRHADVSFMSKDGFVNLSFTNLGTGIPGRDMENIFRPFHRAGNVSSFPGHGLGLALTKKIIELHKGTISIISEENKSTTVTIVLPLC